MGQSVGISGLGSHLPGPPIKISDALDEKQLPRIRREKIGVAAIHRTPPGQGPSDTAIIAARAALADAGIDAAEVDVLIYAGEHKDHLRWQAEAKVQSELCCDSAFGFDFYQSGSGQAMGLKVMADLLLDDAHLKTALIVAAESWHSSLETPLLGRSFILGDGASACVLQKDHPRLRLLAASARTIGEHHRTFCIPGLGTSNLLDESVLKEGGHRFQVHLPKQRAPGLLESYWDWQKKLLADSLKKAGRGISDVALLVLPNLPRHHGLALLESLGLPAEKSTLAYGQDTGLLGTADLFYNLQRAKKEGRFVSGDAVVLFGIGAAYNFVSLVLEA